MPLNNNMIFCVVFDLMKSCCVFMVLNRLCLNECFSVCYKLCLNECFSVCYKLCLNECLSVYYKLFK